MTAIPDKSIALRLHWDFCEGSETVDLDCSAVLFDECGFVLDAAFYNNLSAADECVKHSGENRTDLPDGANEQIVLHLPRLPANVSTIALVVNAFCGSTLARLETAFVSISEHEGAAKLLEMSVCGGKSGAFRETGVVLGTLRRTKTSDGRGWEYDEHGVPCAGRNFVESLPIIQKVVDARIEPEIVAERGSRVLSTTRTFTMKKGNVGELPESVAMGSLFVGLGWSCTHKIDLDASVIAMKEDGTVLGVTSFKNQTGIAVKSELMTLGPNRHSGDNVTGDGDGDDEVIDLNLPRVREDVKNLFVVVNIYTTWASFRDVHDAWVRLVSREGGGKERVLNYYKLDETVTSRGLVFLRVFRRPLKLGWAVEAIGQGCEGRTADSAATVAACRRRDTAASDATSANNQSQGWNYLLVALVLLVAYLGLFSG